MAKGYWIVNEIVHDMDVFKEYQAANAEPLARYDGKFMVRGGTQEVREGTAFPRTVMVEFASYQDAVACYEDPQYQAAMEFRKRAADATFLIVEGAD